MLEFGVRNTVRAPAGSVVAGGVYHVVGTYDGANVRLYVDGVQVASGSLAGVLEQSLGGMHIGSWDGASEFFDGTIDEAAVYPSVLSAERIAAHFAVSGAHAEVPPASDPPPTRSTAEESPKQNASETSVSSSPSSGSVGVTASAAVHFPCTGRDASTTPCRFSTPSGNIRCLWTPTPNNVACDLVASGRAYRLQPKGHAKAIKLKLTRAGQVLARGEQIVFPKSLSCRDTLTSVTCNQDFGVGAFRLAPKGSHGS